MRCWCRTKEARMRISMSPKQISRRSSRCIAIMVTGVGILCCMYSPAFAQRAKANLHLRLGESVSGADHPEYFSRYSAFHTMLDVLAIQPANALQLQHRARGIERNVM